MHKYLSYCHGVTDLYFTFLVMSYLIILDFTLFLSLLFYRTILAALHFNYNLNRDSKTDGQGRPVLYVTYPKFKEGEATVREAKVSANYGSY